MSPLILFMNTTAFWAAAFSAPVLLCFSGYFVYRAFAAKRSYRKLDRESAKKIANKAILYLIGSVSAVAYCVYAYSQNPAATKFSNFGGSGSLILLRLVVLASLVYSAFVLYRWIRRICFLSPNKNQNRKYLLISIAYILAMVACLRSSALFDVGRWMLFIGLGFVVFSFVVLFVGKNSGKRMEVKRFDDDYVHDLINNPINHNLYCNVYHDDNRD